MKPKRLKLQHEYHDGIIRAVEYRNAEDVSLGIELCGCGNATPSSVHLTFTGVRNFAEVQKSLEDLRLANATTGRIAEIVGIVRDETRGYILDIGGTAGLRLDARGLHET